MSGEPKCRWCGKTYEQHRDKPQPGIQPRVPCLGLKAHWVGPIHAAWPTSDIVLSEDPEGVRSCGPGGKPGHGMMLCEEALADVCGRVLAPVTGFAVEFTAHVPPVAYQTSKRRKPAHVQAYQEALQGHAMQAKCKYGSWPMHRFYRLTIIAYFANAKIRDWDNSGQPVSNALKDVLYYDDYQVQTATVAKVIDRKDPRVFVRCEVIA